MDSDLNLSLFKRWLSASISDGNLDEAVVLNSDGTFATEDPHILRASPYKKVFSRQMLRYVEQQKSFLTRYFNKTTSIEKEIRNLVDYTAVLCDKEVVLKRDLFCGSLSSLPATLLSSPALEVFQLKKEISDTVVALGPKQEIEEKLEALYNHLFDLYRQKLISPKGLDNILEELLVEIDNLVANLITIFPLSSPIKFNNSIESFVQKKKYHIAVLTITTYCQDFLFTKHENKFFDFIMELPIDQIQKIIDMDSRVIGELWKHLPPAAKKESCEPGSGLNFDECAKYFHLDKKAVASPRVTSIAEQKRQLRLKLRAEQEMRGAKRKTVTTVSHCYPARKSSRLKELCRKLDPALAQKIYELDSKNMGSYDLTRELKHSIGLNEQSALPVCKSLISPEGIDTLNWPEHSEEKSPADIFPEQKHGQQGVTVLPDESSSVRSSPTGIQMIDLVADTPKHEVSETSFDQAWCDHDISPQSLADAMIKVVGEEYPEELEAHAGIIREYVGNVSLNSRQIRGVMTGHKPTIEYLLMCCQIMAAGFQKEMALQQEVSSASGLSVMDVDTRKIDNTHHFGVNLRLCAGIQANDNNCGLAAFFMSISNNGLLDHLIQDAENRLASLQSSKDERAYPLIRLIRLLNHFNCRGNLDKFIPNEGLDDLRLHYRLRVARVNPEEIAAVEARKENLVTLTVASEFHRGADLNASNRDAAVTFEYLEYNDEPSAIIRKLPDKSLGCMMIRGCPLSVGEHLTIADLQQMEFVPLGEFLEPIEFIPPILNEIYDFSHSAPAELHNFSMWQKSTTSFKQKVSIVEVQSDCKTEGISSQPSKDFCQAIEGESIPESFILFPEVTCRNPHPFMENVVGSLVEQYFQDGVLRLKLTIDLHHSSQHETRKTYEFYDENGMFEKKAICELEKYFADESVTFIRAKDTEFIGDQGERKRIELRMVGYSTDRPDNGEVKVRVMHRARNFQELLNIFIDSWKDCFANTADAELARLTLLPDAQHSPEIIFMTIPNEGKDQRCDFDWQTGVNLPMSTGERSIFYDVSAVMSIQDNHYLSWLREPEAGMVHCADSIGEIHPKHGAVPTVVTLPEQKGAERLHLASILAGDIKGYHIARVREKLLSLGQQVALVILKKAS